MVVEPDARQLASYGTCPAFMTGSEHRGDTDAVPAVQGALGKVMVTHVPLLEAALIAFQQEWPPEADNGEMGYLKGPDILGTFLEILLYVTPTPRRDELLRAGFAALDALANIDEGVAIDTTESLAEHEPFRPTAAQWGSQRVRKWGSYDGRPPLQPGRSGVWRGPNDIIDLWNIRPVIAHELEIPVDRVPGYGEAAPRRRNWITSVGDATAWLAVLSSAALSIWLAWEIDDQRGIVVFWGLVVTTVAIFGAVLPTPRARITAAAFLAVFALLGGFSIGDAYAPGALAMLVAATLPQQADEPWLDRFVGVIIAPSVFVLIENAVDLGAWSLIPLLVVSAGSMFPRRRLLALAWGLLALPAAYVLLVTGTITGLLG